MTLGTQAVIDTSVVVKWLNKENEKHVKKAEILLELIIEENLEVFLPELSKYELGNVLLKSKKLSSKEAEIALGAFYSMPITFITESEDISITTYNIAYKNNITYYDASFLTLAKLYGITLITENIKHQGKDNSINVISLKDLEI